jgi:isopentenyl diphosphate isomerase/L-lactate dehydrogenase-like FMN-dependent dehydrogenase
VSFIIKRRYVNKDRAMTKRIVQQAEKRGIQALFITVDAPQLGRREKVGSFCCMTCLS